MDRPKVEIEEPGRGFFRVHVTFLNVGEDARPTILNCAARMRRAASLAHGDPPQGVDPGVLDYEADVLERLADRLTPPPVRNAKTLADILAIMRSEPLYNPHGDPALVEANKVLKNYADLIEAAAVRLVREERTEAIDEALAHAEEVRAAKCRNCTERAPGNCAAMREAIKAVSAAFDDSLICTDYQMSDAELDRMDEIWSKVKAALSAPPRNCDVGTPTEQARRFQLFCQNHRVFDAGCSAKCPFVNAADINHCQAGWSQLLYEGGAN